MTETAWSVRAYREGDADRLAETIGDPSSAAQRASRALIGAASTDPFAASVVAAVGTDAGSPGVVLGAGALAQATLHPSRAWAHVEVAPEERHAGMGSALYAALQEAQEASPLAGLPLRCRVDLGSEGQAVAESRGFRPIQTTRVVRVQAGAVPVPALEGRTDVDVTLTATGSVALTQAFERWYRSVHEETDPVPELGPGRTNRIFLSEQSGAHGAALVSRAGEVSAFAVSYAQPDSGAETELIVGLVGAGDTGAEDAAMLLGLLSAEAPVVVEVTDGMPVLAGVLDGLVKQGTADVLFEYLTMATG